MANGNLDSRRSKAGIYYNRWFADDIFVQVPIQGVVAKRLESFREVPDPAEARELQSRLGSSAPHAEAIGFNSMHRGRLYGSRACQQGSKLVRSPDRIHRMDTGWASEAFEVCWAEGKIKRLVRLCSRSRVSYTPKQYRG
jgi:hypothetical protein